MTHFHEGSLCPARAVSILDYGEQMQQGGLLPHTFSIPSGPTASHFSAEVFYYNSGSM